MKPHRIQLKRSKATGPCAHEGCQTEGNPCFLPDNETGVPDEFACNEHAHALGYCYLCGGFWGGIESFEFNPRRLCDNCDFQVRSDSGEFDGSGEIDDDWC